LPPIFRGEYQIMPNPDVLNVMNSLGIYGRSPLLMQAVNAAIQVAPYDVTVLVTGENGVGKDYFYKILHNGSRRRHNKCIAVNCGGLPEGTIDSELFGHVKGAYTGTVGDRKGYFEEADGGTIFLDEVGDLPMTIQAKLLRVLEKGEIIRMGSNEVRKVDVRIVAATNVDLPKAIREGKFREDLYYRLSTIRINVPSLRDRSEDIELLFRKFANDTAARYRMTEGVTLDEDAKRLLKAYHWPGNVRQLLHVVEELSIIEMDRRITASVLERYLPHFDSGISVGGGTANDSDLRFMPGEKFSLYSIINQLQRELQEIRNHLGIHSPHAPQPRKLASVTSYQHPEVSEPRQLIQESDINIPPRNTSVIEEAEVEEVDTEMPTPPSHYAAPAKANSRKTMAEIEKETIAESLAFNHGNKRKVAEELDISERTIHRKIKEYGLE